MNIFVKKQYIAIYQLIKTLFYKFLEKLFKKVLFYIQTFLKTLYMLCIHFMTQ